MGKGHAGQHRKAGQAREERMTQRYGEGFFAHVNTPWLVGSLNTVLEQKSSAHAETTCRIW